MAITDRTLTVESYGVTYTKATDGAIFSSAATVDTVYPVTALSAVTVNDENTAPGQRLTVSGNTGWSRGDIVQLVSDDVLPGGLPGGGTNEYRCGQHFMVHAASSGTVDLLGTLNDPMSTNIRVHRMRRHRVVFRGGRFTKTGGGVTVAFTRLVAPEFTDAVVHTPRTSSLVCGLRRLARRQRRRRERPQHPHVGHLRLRHHEHVQLLGPRLQAPDPPCAPRVHERQHRTARRFDTVPPLRSPVREHRRELVCHRHRQQRMGHPLR
nr:hypothetical protein [Prescottella equi]